MKGQLRIDAMYAFCIIDDDGTEGVIGMSTDIGWMPFVGANMERVESLKPFAEKIAKESGKRITVSKFTNCEFIMEIMP